MADLSLGERQELARVRDTRMQIDSEEARVAEQARFVRSLDHYTHVTRGFDADGKVRFFAATRWEPGLTIDGQRLALLLVGPTFKEPGAYMRAPHAGKFRLVTAELLRRPFATVVLGSAVSWSGFALMCHYARGVVPIYMHGEDDATPGCTLMLSRLVEGASGEVTWDAERGLLRYPSGPSAKAQDASRLTPEEADRYLARAPGALGDDPGAVVPIALQFDVFSTARWYAKRSGTQLRGLLGAWLGRG